MVSSKRKPQTVLLAAEPESGERFALLDIAASFCGENSSCSRCSKQTDFMGNKCRIMSRVLEGMHPDVIIFNGRDAAKKTDAIRQLIEGENITPVEERFKAYILSGFDYLSDRQQSLLLKTLEEPSGDNRFYIIAENTAKLLDTIKSRAVNMRIPRMGIEDITAMLTASGVQKRNALLAAAMSDGSPGRARSYADRGDGYFDFGIGCAEGLSKFIIGGRAFADAVYIPLYDKNGRIQKEQLLDAVPFWILFITEIIKGGTGYFEGTAADPVKCGELLSTGDCTVLLDYLFKIKGLCEVNVLPSLIADGFANELVKRIRSHSRKD